MLLRLFQQCLHQLFSPSMPLPHGIDSDGTNLRQMLTIEMQSTAPDDAPAIFKYHKIPDVLTDFGEVTRQQGAIAGIGGDQFVNSLGIWKNSLTRLHGLPPEPLRSV